jgi:FMN phosphatase YigB (HAD superfamily)
MIKAIIFDLGKVIVSFDFEIGFQTISQFCDYPVDEIREKIMTSEEIILYETGKLSSREFFEKIRQILNLTATYEQFFDAWNSSFHDDLILSEGFIAELAEKYTLVMLSDTIESHIEFLRQKFSFFKHFDDFVFSYEVGKLKPSPKMFEVAVEKANCAANECLFVDDKLANVEGATAYGLEAIQFLSAEQFYEELQAKITAKRNDNAR